MTEVNEGYMVFLVDNPYPFMVLGYVNGKTEDGLLDCTLVSNIHIHEDVYLSPRQVAVITEDDETVIEMYERSV